jgi:hypothetical protein
MRFVISSRIVRVFLLSSTHTPERVCSQDPFRLELVVPLAQKSQIAVRVRAASRVGDDVVDLKVVR